MRKLLIALGICGAVTLGSSSVAVAGLEEGWEAYKRGDYATALKEFRALASEGDAVATVAQANLGLMYEAGHGVTQDYKEAMKWYLKAAQQGVAASQSNLAVMYLRGRGVTQDNIQAYMWFNIGAKNGHEKAQKGRDYVEKQMTATDISTARKLAEEWMAKHQK
jgi:TPR repeat protein